MHAALTISVAVAVALSLAMPARPASAAARTYYVAPSGNDRWSGRKPTPNQLRTDGPFSTIEHARDVVRALRTSKPSDARGGVRIVLRGGTHYLPRTLVLGPEDSGTASAPVEFIAYPGEHPVISGGLPISGWHRGADSVWSAPLPARLRGRTFRDLRVGERMAIRARYPNRSETHPRTEGWLFAGWWGKPWERGVFGEGVANTQEAGTTLRWHAEFPAASRYVVWLRYGHNMSAYGRGKMDGRTTIAIDNEPSVPLTDLPDTGWWAPTRWARTATIDVPAGEHTITWRNMEGGGINLDAFCLCDDITFNPATAIDTGAQTANPVTPPAGKHLVIIQAETCQVIEGKPVAVSHPDVPGSTERIAVAHGKLPEVADWSHVEVRVFPAWGWVNAEIPVVGIENGGQTLQVHCEQDIRPGNRFFLENARELLDAPGEWFADHVSNRVFYIPRAHETVTTAVAPAMDRLVSLTGDPKAGHYVQHIRFEGITFRDADWNLGGYYAPADAAIALDGARSCTMARCRFECLGGYAVRIEHQSSRNRIIRCAMSGLGQGGVILLGSNADQPTDNEIAACVITDCGRIYAHVAGIYVTTGSRNKIAHNRILRMPRYGISLKSQNADNASHGNIVEYNEIVDSNLETNDTGAIETLGRDQQESGNVIRYNVIRRVVGLKTDTAGNIMTPYFTWGIYLDDYSSGTVIEGNVVQGTVLGGICIHGGRNNRVENNIFLDGSEMNIRLQPRDDFMHGNAFRRNIVCYRNPKALLWYSYADTWRPDRLSDCSSNVYWHTGGLDIAHTSLAITPEGAFARWQQAGLDRNSRVADPQIVDSARGDFRLRPSSPAIALGFRPLPLAKVGPIGYTEKDR